MVAETDPVAGATLGTGSPVTIHVSNGKAPSGGD
jgi:beta-lactam-binding protein with PASTA domain